MDRLSNAPYSIRRAIASMRADSQILAEEYFAHEVAEPVARSKEVANALSMDIDKCRFELNSIKTDLIENCIEDDSAVKWVQAQFPAFGDANPVNSFLVRLAVRAGVNELPGVSSVVLSELLEMLHSDDTVNVAELARRTGRAYSTTYEAIGRAMSQLQRQLQSDPVVQDWLDERYRDESHSDLPRTSSSIRRQQSPSRGNIAPCSQKTNLTRKLIDERLLSESEAVNLD